MENLEKAIIEIKQNIPRLKLLENETMAAHSSFKIGGPVRVMTMPSCTEELKALCAILKNNGVTPLLLGNGTNILFPDEGLNDLIIINTGLLTKLELLDDGRIYAQAGVSMAKLASFAQQNGLKGLEFASGIPGSLGGGILMNAGAYDGELKDAIESVTVFSLFEQDIKEFNNSECAFVYRGSYFHEKGGFAILSAVLRLEKGCSSEISAKMRELNERRREKQPLDLPSAGSAFKRPEGYFAAALIDQAGLKGFSVGGAQVSEKHAGFVVNAGNATAKDVRELMEQVQKIVYEKNGIMMEPEIIMLPPEYRGE